MKALTVLLVLLLSTPAYAYCDTYENVSSALVNHGYVYSQKLSDSTALFIDYHYQQWVIVNVTEQACIIEGGVYL